MCLIFFSGQAMGWNSDGHHTVGAIADQLIAGTNASVQVKAILGGLSLQDAAVWADCAKGVDPQNNYAYQPAENYPECKIFETPALEAEMSDFVRRNDTNCSPKPGEESCHKQYHYTDISIAHDHYDPHFTGAKNYDVVNVITAAMHVLKGDPSPAPFNIKDKREALLLLAHHVGDIHQPLHVGAIYLDKKGHNVDPDRGTYEWKIDTQGGNDILVGTDNLHSIWDNIPVTLKKKECIEKILLPEAKVVPVTKGQIYDWPLAWANGSIVQAKKAFTGIKFTPQLEDHWYAILPSDYYYKMEMIKQPQLVNAGARLAQVLQTIWP
jgi:hypothetical protein